MSVIGYDPWSALVAPDTWTLPEGLTKFCRLTKPGMFPERTKVKACGQLICFVTVNAVKDGCASKQKMKKMQAHINSFS